MSGRDVRLAPAAARQFRKLPADVKERVREALAAAAGRSGRGGKSTKTIRGRGDSFHRLRVGDYRVMYDVTSDRALLVLGIVHRRDLERWLRGR